MQIQKALAELAYWESRLTGGGRLSNDHFEYFFTGHFGLEKDFFRGKKILDIGCGPRGSLEWATEAGLRIGIDPLAEAYRQLGTSLHVMTYVACYAENLPFPGGCFDIVSSFNSLDHVDRLGNVIDEIGRVTASGGDFLLLTDIHQNPTVLEPAAFSWEVVNQFKSKFTLVEQRQVEYTVFSTEGFGDMYQSLKRGTPYDFKDASIRYGILSARFHKQ